MNMMINTNNIDCLETATVKIQVWFPKNTSSRTEYEFGQHSDCVIELLLLSDIITTVTVAHFTLLAVVRLVSTDNHLPNK